MLGLRKLHLNSIQMPLRIDHQPCRRYALELRKQPANENRLRSFMPAREDSFTVAQLGEAIGADSGMKSALENPREN